MGGECVAEVADLGLKGGGVRMVVGREYEWKS